jgi:hypothetical protein
LRGGFKTAFDCVQRPLIWQRLQDCGVHGAMLTAVQSLYDEVLLQVKVGGERSAPFSSQQGVKQGDPSSPTLFGLFIEVLHEMLAAECAGTGPTIAGIGTLVETLDLIYADDVILLATSAASLQRQLRTLEQFCVLFEMKVNLLKTDVIVFRSAYNHKNYKTSKT